MIFQERADDLALYALAAAMDDADFVNAGAEALLDILFHDAGNVLGSKGVEIDGIFYGENDRSAKGRVGSLRGRGFS